MLSVMLRIVVMSIAVLTSSTANAAEATTRTETANSVADSLVVVIGKSGEGPRESAIYATGMVVHKDKKRAVVVCPNMGFDQIARRFRYSLHWLKNGVVKNVPAQLVSPYSSGSGARHYQFVAAPESLPAAAPPPKASPKLSYPLKIRLHGMRITDLRPLRFERWSEESRIDEYRSDDRASFFLMRIEPGVPVDVIATLPDGSPLTGFTNLVGSEARRSLNISRPKVPLPFGLPRYDDFLAQWRRTPPTYAGVYPLSGDASTIKYAVVVFIADPLKLGRKYKVRIKRTPDHQGRIPLADGLWTRMPDATEVTLKPMDVTKIPYQPNPVDFPHATILTGEITMPHTRPIPQHWFKIQLQYDVKPGQPSYSAKMKGYYNPLEDPKRPAIPNLIRKRWQPMD